jgi:hypothetical protein
MKESIVYNIQRRNTEKAIWPAGDAEDKQYAANYWPTLILLSVFIYDGLHPNIWKECFLIFMS